MPRKDFDKVKATKRDLLSYQAGKFWLKTQTGMTETQALKELGYNLKGEGHPANVIKKTKVFQALEEKYSDILKRKISPSSVADEHIKNILQDKDKGAKNTAIKMYKDAVEPDEQGVIKAGEVKIVFQKA